MKGIINKHNEWKLAQIPFLWHWKEFERAYDLFFLKSNFINFKPYDIYV